MIRRHATWMVIHPRSATFVSCLCFNFGEVFDVASIRCCVRCWGPFGLAQLLGGKRRSRGDRPTLSVTRNACHYRSSEVLAVQVQSAKFRHPRGTPILHFTLYILHSSSPVAGTRCRFSPRNRVTKNRTRRCQRSNSASPLRGKTEIVCHIPPPNASGILEI